MRKLIPAALLFAASCGNPATAPANEAVANPQVIDPIAVEAAAVAERARSILRDPSSAQFRNVRRMTTLPGPANEMSTYIYCGEINARNAFGGYTGFQKFGAQATPADRPNRGVEIVQEGEPASRLFFDAFCKDNGRERTDGTPVNFPNSR